MAKRVPLTREERRARREERRAKQREANVGRAAKMHAARMAHEGREESDPAGAGVSDSRQQFFVGCSGWFYWHWRDCFYPQGSPSNTWFDHYASQFDTVEL